MPRSNRPRRGGRRLEPGPVPEELDADRALAGGRFEEHADGAWMVRRVAGSGAKAYRCPGCDQAVAPGTPHIVAWRADEPIGGLGGVGDRRHWHTPCWTSRDRRSPTGRAAGRPRRGR